MARYRPARSSTPSSFAASSGVALTIGSRCSLSVEQAELLHHVLHRNRVRVEEHGLVDLEQLLVQAPARSEIAGEHGFAHLREHLRLQIADGVHEAAGADRHHREAELLEPHEHFEVAAELVQALGNEAEIVDGLLDADEVRRAVLDGFQRVERDADGRAARDVVDHPRHVVPARELQVIRDEAALRRPDVVRRDDQERVGAGVERVLGQHAALRERLRARCRDDGHAAGRRLDGERHEPVALVGRQRRGLGRRAVDEDAVRAFLDLEFDELRIAVVIDVAAFERSDERRNRAAQRGESMSSLRHFLSRRNDELSRARKLTVLAAVNYRVGSTSSVR